MSGGHFDGKEYILKHLAEELEELVTKREEYNLSANCVRLIKRQIHLLECVYITIHRIDYLVSGDDSEETFHKRLREELLKYNANNL